MPSSDRNQSYNFLVGSATIGDDVAESVYTELVSAGDSSLEVNYISAQATMLTNKETFIGLSLFVKEGDDYHFLDFIPVLFINLRPYIKSNVGSTDQPASIAYAVWNRKVTLDAGQGLYIRTATPNTSDDKSVSISAYGSSVSITPITQVLVQ